MWESNIINIEQDTLLFLQGPPIRDKNVAVILPA